MFFRDRYWRGCLTYRRTNLGLISWIVFGALAGWAASLLVGTNDRHGCLTNIIIGVIGSFLGGFLYSQVTGRQMVFDWSVPSFAVAVIGSLVLLLIVGIFRRT